MAYTVDDSPEVRRAVGADLDDILEAVREADPSLRSLVLTGAFARGEGAVLDGQAQNDYDLLAIRGLARPADYEPVVSRMEAEVDTHVDLAPIQAWRLPLVGGTIFWYETARRGRVLWGEELLDRIPVRNVGDLEPTEGLRLLVNRAAGLLLGIDDDPRERRLQAAKGLLAAMDVHLLSQGAFPPSQRERWAAFRARHRVDGTLPDRCPRLRWLSWAFQRKTDPGSAEKPDPGLAWRTAAAAVLDAVPVALDHAGLDSLPEYRARDGLLDHLAYIWSAGSVPGGRRVVRNPTGSIHVATLRLLEASKNGKLDPSAARKHLQGLVDSTEPLEALEALHGAKLR